MLSAREANDIREMAINKRIKKRDKKRFERYIRRAAKQGKYYVYIKRDKFSKYLNLVIENFLAENHYLGYVDSRNIYIQWKTDEEYNF